MVMIRAPAYIADRRKNYMNLIAYWWPVILVLAANTVYHISSKAVPAAMDPYAAVFCNYVVAMAASFVLWMVLGKDHSLSLQLSRINWAPVVMGLSITAVEISFVFMYKLGWNISIGSTITNIAMAIALAIIGILFYKEVVTAQQMIGIGLCLIGLVVMNWK